MNLANLLHEHEQYELIYFTAIIAGISMNPMNRMNLALNPLTIRLETIYKRKKVNRMLFSQ